jgi:hypothetical protein
MPHERSFPQRQLTQNSWNIYANGYKDPYSKGAQFANDWLEGSIQMHIAGKDYSFPLGLLIIEELEDFARWLSNISNGIETDRSFQFMDPELSFELIEEKNALVLRLIYGLESEPRVSVETRLLESPSFLPSQIAHLHKLLKQFPCRCKAAHNVLIHSS